MQVVLDGTEHLKEAVLPDDVIVTITLISGTYYWKAVKLGECPELLANGSTDDFVTAAIVAFASVCIDKPK